MTTEIAIMYKCTIQQNNQKITVVTEVNNKKRITEKAAAVT